ncbi:MAG: glutathione S-transferase family protein [Myxococcota bacterium]|nr:glutathione S-transferase family protein [Myxococcota bacterium]
MIKLYTAPTPNGRKASIALEELGVPYEVERVDINAPEHPTPGFLAIAPNHKIPVIDDDGLVIWESGAILLHLAEKHGKLLPADPAGRMAAIQYAFFQTGGIGPNLGRLGQQLRRPESERNAEMTRLFTAEVDRLLGVIDRILADGRPFLAGEYSIGDIMHYPWLSPLQVLRAPQLTSRERVVSWMDRIGERPAVQRGMQVPT